MSPHRKAKRKYNRVKIVQEAWLYFKGSNYGPCRIRDINLTGLFVYGPFHQRTGDECILGYSEERTASNCYFKAKARVVRTKIDGIALEFKSMPLDSYILLQSTLLYEAADPLTIVYDLPADCPFIITDEL